MLNLEWSNINLPLYIASGLYYLAEFVEEYTVITRKIISRSLQLVFALHVLLLVFHPMPWRLTLFSLGCHVVYSQLLRSFPVIQLSDPVFLLSCVLAVANHFLWFSHFTSTRMYEFNDICGFFVFIVWLVPFSFFISLSAADNILPNYEAPTGSQRRKSQFGNVVKNSLGWLFKQKDFLLPPKTAIQKVI